MSNNKTTTTKIPYSERTTRIRIRKDPELITRKDDSKFLSSSETFQYITTAMSEVDKKYTETTKEAAEKVIYHLDILNNVKFEMQGSVMTNSHIKGHSDIDLIVLTNKSFYNYVNRSDLEKYWIGSKERDLISKSLSYPPYEGDTKFDLRMLRLESEGILKNKYIVCDCAGPKSIKILNQDLHRYVDTSIACFQDDTNSVIKGSGIYRGIRLYNKKDDILEAVEYPFLRIKRHLHRDKVSNSNFNKLIRFLKNIKEDEGNIKLSGYQITSLLYQINPVDYFSMDVYNLVFFAKDYLYQYISDKINLTSVPSIDGRTDVFKSNDEKSHIYSLYLAVSQVCDDLMTENIERVAV